MAGRGGYKPNTSLRPEQLQGMGITSLDLQNAAIVIPVTYPPLLNRPNIPEITPEREYVISWKDTFQTYLKNSPYFTTSAANGTKPYRRYYLESARSERKFGSFSWEHLPAELKPNFKRKQELKDGSAKLLKVVNVEETLKALEQAEVAGLQKQEENEDLIKEEQKDSDEENENVEDEEHDNEMDEDNDYGCNYFDNGDDYNEDSEEDGPIY